MKKLLLFLLSISLLHAGDFTRKQVIDYYTWLKCAGCPGVYYDLSSWIYGMEKEPQNYILLSHYYDKTYQGEVTEEAFEFSEALQKGFPALTLNRSFQSFGSTPICSLANKNESQKSPFSLNFKNIVVNESSHQVSGEIVIGVGEDFSGNCNIELFTARDSVKSLNLQSNGFTKSKGHPLYNKGIKLPVYYSKMIANNYIFPKYGKSGLIPANCKKGDTFTIPFSYMLKESDPLKHLYLVAWINKDSAEVLQAELTALAREDSTINQFYTLKMFEKGSVDFWTEGSQYPAGTRITDGRIVYNTSYESSIDPQKTSRPENKPGLTTLTWLNYWTAVGYIKDGVDIAHQPFKKNLKPMISAGGVIHFSEKDEWLRVYNAKGQRLKEINLQELPISTINLNSFTLSHGAYIITLQQGRNVMSETFIMK